MLRWLSSAAHTFATATQSAAASLSVSSAGRSDSNDSASFIRLWEDVRVIQHERAVNRIPIGPRDALVDQLTKLVDVLCAEARGLQLGCDELFDALLDTPGAPGSWAPHGSADFVRQGPCLQVLLEIHIVDELCALGGRDEPPGMEALVLHAVNRIIRLQPDVLLPLLHDPINELLRRRAVHRAGSEDSRTVSEPMGLGRHIQSSADLLHREGRPPSPAERASVLLCHTVWRALSENPSLLACFTRPAGRLGTAAEAAEEIQDVTVLTPVIPWMAEPLGSEHGDAARDSLLIAAALCGETGCDDVSAEGGATILAHFLRVSGGGAGLVSPAAELFSRALRSADTRAVVGALWAGVGVGDAGIASVQAAAGLVDAAAALLRFLGALIETAEAVGEGNGLEPFDPSVPRHRSELAQAIMESVASHLCEGVLVPALYDMDDKAAAGATLCATRLLRGLAAPSPAAAFPSASAASHEPPLLHLVTGAIIGAAPLCRLPAGLQDLGGALREERLLPGLRGFVAGAPATRAALLCRIRDAPAPLAAVSLDLVAHLLARGDRIVTAALLSPGSDAEVAQPLPLPPVYFREALRRAVVALRAAAASASAAAPVCTEPFVDEEGRPPPSRTAATAGPLALPAASAPPGSEEGEELLDWASPALAAAYADASAAVRAYAEQDWADEGREAAAAGEAGVAPPASALPLVDALLSRATRLLDDPAAVTLPLTQCLTALLRSSAASPAVTRYLLDPPAGGGAAGGRLFGVVAGLWGEAHRRARAASDAARGAEAEAPDVLLQEWAYELLASLRARDLGLRAGEMTESS